MQRFVVVEESTVVLLDDLCEIVPTHQILQRFARLVKTASDVPGRSTGGGYLVSQIGYPPLDQVGKRAAFGPTPRSDVPHQFAIEGSRLSPGAMQAALHCDVGTRDNEFPFQRNRADEVQEEGLS